MLVTACIVSYKNKDDVLRCIDALRQCNYNNLDIVICENGGPLHQSLLIDSIPQEYYLGRNIKILHAPNPGYGGAFNICVDASKKSDLWWLINPDCVPEPDALAALISRFEVGDCDAVGGTLCLPNGKVQAYGGRFRNYIARAESIGNGQPIASVPDRDAVEGSMNYILGASILVGRRFLNIVGPMRHDYFLYAEEIEWCLRGVARGMRLGFAPSAIVHHNQGSTTGSGKTISRRPRLPVYLDERNKLHVVRDTNPGAFPIALVGALMFIFFRYTRRGAFTQSLHAFQGWMAAVRNERGYPKGWD